MRVGRLTALLAVLFVVAAACSEKTPIAGGDIADSAITVEPEAPDTPAPATDSRVSGLTAGLSDFDIQAVAWNGYWYSRYNLGNLVMMSGMGVPFEPPMEAVMGMAAMVDLGSADGEHVMMPENAALLSAVFAGGDPEFLNTFNGTAGDFTNWRWDPSQMDTRLLPAAQAQTIIKEIEWAKLFNNGGWAGGLTDDFGAMDRFKGMAMFAGARMQSLFALDNLRNEDGFFVASSRFVDGAVVHEDPSVDLADQYQMLQALSDLRLVLQDPGSFNGVYEDGASLAILAPAVDDFFTRVAPLEATTIQDLSLGAQAFTWFAVATDDEALRTMALDRLSDFGDALVTTPREGVIDRSQAIRGLMESARVLGDVAHLEAAAADFDDLVSSYDGATGSFAGISTLTTWEVGDIIGALNTLRLNGQPAVSRERVEAVLVGFFEATINRGGLMRAVIPKEMEASPFELARLDNDIYFAYPGIPTPDQAGGPNGSAAVDVAEIRFDSGTSSWKVADAGFVTAATMHASNEMFWVWGFQDGFPKVPGTTGLLSDNGQQQDASGLVVEVSAAEFAFSPAELNLAPGTEVTLRLRNDGVIVHNIDIAEWEVFVEAGPGEMADVTFTVPDAVAPVFFCNIPGHREAGMEGSLTLTEG